MWTFLGKLLGTELPKKTILYDTEIDQETATQIVREVIAGKRSAVYRAGTLSFTVDGVCHMLNVSCEKNSPKLRKALAECYLKYKTPAHSYWKLSKELVMADCRLAQSDLVEEFTCPHCGQGLYIDEWLTEYGYPMLGCPQHVRCPKCDEKFSVTVEQTLHFYTNK